MLYIATNGSCTMNDMAKIVKTGGRQAVQLPEGYGFAGEEVRVVRAGQCIVLEPIDAIDEETGLPLDELRALIQEGLDSGDAGPLDMAEIKREARAAFQLSRHR